MSESHVTKAEWIAMFQAIGLDAAAMKRWHQEFEKRHPEGHAAFLRWLGVDEREIGEIRRHAST